MRGRSGGNRKLFALAKGIETVSGHFLNFGAGEFEMYQRMAIGLLVISALLSGAIGAPNARAQEKRPSADDLLAKVAERYKKLEGYHFEHTLVVEQQVKGEKAKEIARVKLTTASERRDDPPRLWDEGPFSFNLKRMRLQADANKRQFLMACDGDQGWVYQSESNEYIERPANRPLYGPTAATMYQGVHLAPLCRFRDGSLRKPRLLDDETVAIGEQRYDCHVLECESRPVDMALPSGETVPNPFSSASGLVALLTINGFAEAPSLFKPADKAESNATLWVDKKVPIVRQGRYREAVQTAADGEDAEATETQLIVTDQYQIANIDGKLAPEVFRFTPPAKATQVEKFGAAKVKEGTEK